MAEHHVNVQNLWECLLQSIVSMFKTCGNVYCRASCQCSELVGMFIAEHRVSVQNLKTNVINHLTHFMSLVYFYAPQKHHSFSDVLVGVEWSQWHKMGSELFFSRLN